MTAERADSAVGRADAARSGPPLRLSRAGGVCELTLAAPPCNEIGSAMLDALEKTIASGLDGADALIIHSAMEGGFCAGANLRELAGALATQRDHEERRRRVRSFIDRIHRVMDRLDTLPLTTIGVIHGICFGGGFELALTCDVLIAERTARFAFPELRLGLIPGFGGIPRLSREVGQAVVRDLLLTGRSINARRAHALGLVSQLVGRGAGLEVARSTAQQAARLDRTARLTAKRFTKRLPREELARERAHFLHLFDRGEVERALRQFVARDDALPYLPADRTTTEGEAR